MFKNIIKRFLSPKLIDIYIAINLHKYNHYVRNKVYMTPVEIYKLSVKNRCSIGGGQLRVKNLEQLQLRNNVSIGSNYNIWIHSNDGIEQKSNDVKYDGRLYIGDNVRIGEFVKVDCYSKITIEKDCLLASHITIMDSQHGMNPETKRSYVFQSSKAAPIVIHEGVWIGENVHILSGSNIGKKSIIGAGAVVKGTIPPYTIAAGVPAKVIKKWNFDEKVWERV